MAHNAGVLEGLESIADRMVTRGLVSSLFSRSPLLSMLAARGGGENSDSTLRPGSFGLLGGQKVTRGRRLSMEGGNTVFLPPVLTGTVGGTTLMTKRGTGPTVTDPTTNTFTDKIVRPFVNSCKVHTPILVWNTDLEKANGRFALLDVVQNAVNLAIEEQTDTILEILWNGTVGSGNWGDDIWPSQQGITDVCSDSDIYGIDRSEIANNKYDGKQVTASTTAALAMIDEANIEQGIAQYGPGIDTLLCNPTAYEKIKVEALTKGGTIIHSGMPEAAEAGITTEALRYGNVLITVDWGIKNYTGVGTHTSQSNLSDNVFGLTMGDWVFQVDAGASFSVSPFTDLELTNEGGKDAKQAILKTHFRFWCERPWNQMNWSTVT